MLVSIRGELIQPGELNNSPLRYDISGATGKEVAILDLHQGAGEVHPWKEGA